MTVWVIGTSVSVQRAGWSGRLARAIDEGLVNLSIGDQVSIMGLARLSQVAARIQAEDIVIWEYPLLDVLLEEFFGREDILQAMQQAWHMTRTAGAYVILVIFPPKRDVAQPSEVEVNIRAVASQASVPIIDLRRFFDSPGEAISHYKDNRHIDTESPVLDALTDALGEQIAVLRNGDAPQPQIKPPDQIWRWWPSEELGAKETKTRESSLLSVMVAALKPNSEKIHLPPHRRFVAAVIVSERTSGALWCGHPLCAPASCRLPEHLNYPFLLRSTRLPCVRDSIKSLCAAPRYALANGSWSDYALVPTVENKPVELVGVLLEHDRSPTSPLSNLIG